MNLRRASTSSPISVEKIASVSAVSSRADGDQGAAFRVHGRFPAYETHNSAVVEYALRDVAKPIGVSTFRVTRELRAPVGMNCPLSRLSRVLSPNLETSWTVFMWSVVRLRALSEGRLATWISKNASRPWKISVGPQDVPARNLSSSGRSCCAPEPAITD